MSSESLPLSYMRDLLWFTLHQLDLDADAYTDYLLSLLSAHSLEVREFLTACGLTESNVEQLVSQWVALRERGTLTESESEWVAQQYALYAEYGGEDVHSFDCEGNNCEGSDSLTRPDTHTLSVDHTLHTEHIQPDTSQRSHTSPYPFPHSQPLMQPCTDSHTQSTQRAHTSPFLHREPHTDVLHTDLSHTLPEDLTEEELNFLQEHFEYDTTLAITENEYDNDNDNDCETDWLAVIDDVERILRENHHCTQSFSPTALFSALSISTEKDRKYAAKLLFHSAHVVNSLKPCRHALLGKCLRRDCTFVHDFEAFPCRYWLFSACTNESSGTCPFSHTLVLCERDGEERVRECERQREREREQQREREIEEEKKKTATQQTHTHAHTVAESAFPSLAESASLSHTQSKSKHRNKQPTGSVWAAQRESSESKWVSAVKKQTQPSHSTQDTHSAHNNAQSNTRAVSSERTNTTGHIGFLESLALHDFVARKESVSVSVSVSGKRESGKAAVRVSDWVESGSVVKLDYEELRRDARDFAILRNKFFQEATTAYLNGSSAAARALSQQGRVAQREMERCHAIAAKTLFRRRNPPLSLCAGQIDLHGLHASEACACLDELLPLFRSAHYCSVRVVTGSGHHTLGPHTGKSRLHPSIKEYLERETRFAFQDVRDQQGYKGGFVVHLSP